MIPSLALFHHAPCFTININDADKIIVEVENKINIRLVIFTSFTAASYTFPNRFIFHLSDVTKEM